MSSLSSLFRFTGRLALAGALLASAPAFLGCTPQVTVLSGRATSPEFHTITVLGQGEASAKPDLALATFGVEVIAPAVADASAQAAARMNQILAAFKRAGIADKDIQTSNFSVNRDQQPEYVAPPPMVAPPAPAPKGMQAPSMAMPQGYPQPQRMVEVYRVSNTVAVKIRNLQQVGAVLDAAIAAGANSIHGIQFALDTTDALAAQAREKAAADARGKAEALAKLQGVSLSGVVSISETAGGGMPYPVSGAMWAAKGMAEGGGTPASPGEVSLTAQVQVVYALKGAAAAE
jgi:uncharacterized protein